MKKAATTARSLLTVLTLLVSACASIEPGQTPQSPANTEIPQVVEQSIGQEQPALPAADPILRARILADMLYEARLAFEDNRLTLPAGDNAFDKYLEVLSVDPENQVALQGIADIAQRYVAMANTAINNGQFDNADTYLNRAQEIDPDKPEIAEVRRTLARERSLGREYFELDPMELDAQSLEIMSRLGSIGEYVRNNEATFLITARTDAEGRWIYRIMREAVGGYRLRGNIILGSRPKIQIEIPQS